MRMLLVQTIACARGFGDFEGIRLLADAGYDAVDYSFSPMKNDGHVLNTDEYKNYIRDLNETAKNNNIIFTQGHAVYGLDVQDEEEAYKLYVKKNTRVLEAASLLGIDIVVFHPFFPKKHMGNEEYLFHANMKYFKEMLKPAEKYGVKIAVENMFTSDKRAHVLRGSACSNPYEHAYYVDSIGHEMFVACLDVGHSSLAGREAQDCIRVLGHRLQALHIHDNDYLDDMHTLPGLSEMNWDEITKALAEINYSGNFTFETDHFFDSFQGDYELERTALKLSEIIGRRLIDKINGYKR
ncbi:MAG: sugar phosphate isomerase/epimerase [Clostridia bacterium]|nr:sugar phosphate isomerase/epimerase [Clostridia bacterium]